MTKISQNYPPFDPDRGVQVIELLRKNFLNFDGCARLYILSPVDGRIF